MYSGAGCPSTRPPTSSGAIGRNRLSVARNVNADRKSVYTVCSSSIRPEPKSSIIRAPISWAASYRGTSEKPDHEASGVTPRNRK